MKDARVIAHRGGKTGQRRSDIDDGILRWTEGQENRQQSQTRKQPCFAQAGHQAHTVTRQPRTQRQTVLHAAGQALGIGGKKAT